MSITLKYLSEIINHLPFDIQREIYLYLINKKKLGILISQIKHNHYIKNENHNVVRNSPCCFPIPTLISYNYNTQRYMLSTIDSYLKKTVMTKETEFGPFTRISKKIYEKELSIIWDSNNYYIHYGDHLYIEEEYYNEDGDKIDDFMNTSETQIGKSCDNESYTNLGNDILFTLVFLLSIEKYTHDWKENNFIYYDDAEARAIGIIK